MTTSKTDVFSPKLAEIADFIEKFRDFAPKIDEIKELERELFDPPYRSEKAQGLILDVLGEIGTLVEELETALAEDDEE